MKNETVFLEAAIEAAGVSRFLIRIAILCFLAAAVEGYDIQAMAFAAPMISEAWNVSPQTMGVLLTASLVGLAFGTMLVAPLGDRFGRRPTIIATLAVAGAAMGLTAFARDIFMLGALRFVAGVAMGGTIPNLLALCLEYSPNRRKVLFVVLFAIGFPVGAGLGGALAGQLSADFGWSAIFWFGGAATLACALLFLAALPESVFTMLLKLKSPERAAALLRRVSSRFADVDPGLLRAHERPVERANVRSLFSDGRGPTTALLWIVELANMSMLYFFISWLPSLFAAQGFEVQSSIHAAAVFNGGGVLGSIGLAMLMSRMKATTVLGGAYVAAAIAVLLLSGLTRLDALFFTAVFLAGAFIVGSQGCLSAIIGEFYPSSIRATGAGYAATVGRVGAISAPVLGGIVIAGASNMQSSFLIAAAPAVIAAVAVGALIRGRRLERSLTA